jgi:hypothetical protein
MNYIRHLSNFFSRVASDKRLNPTHVSLYMAIFQYWNTNHFQNPISVCRQDLMQISKISAKATYHKCIKDLHNFQYFDYHPSFNPFTGSSIYMFEFQTGSSSKSGQYQTKIETSTEQAPYNINIKNIENNIKTSTSKKAGSINEVVVRVKNDNAKVIEIDGQKIPPASLSEITNFFLARNSTKLEAQKFYNHFQSIGWLVGGKSPMTDWQAAARNWILNIPEFAKGKQKSKTPKPNKLNTEESKNYSEAL